MSRWTKGTLDHDGDGRKGGSLPNKRKDIEDMAESNQKPVIVNQGAVYEPNDGGDRVVAFFVDRPRSEVRYARLGSAREDRMEMQEFLDGFKLVSQEGEALPEDREENLRATRRQEKEGKQARNTGTRNETINTAVGTPTRAAGEARNAKRNAK